MSASPGDMASIERRSIELEYTTLRTEILKRIELRQQIVASTLTLAGIFLGVGLSTESVTLIYPPLAMFMALAWAQNDFRIRDQARYIRENLESSLPGLQYETFMRLQRLEGEGMRSWRFVVLSHGGIFLITQLMAVGIELSKFTFNALEWALLGLDLLALLVVIWVVIQAGKKDKAPG